MSSLSLEGPSESVRYRLFQGHRLVGDGTVETMKEDAFVTAGRYELTPSDAGTFELSLHLHPDPQGLYAGKAEVRLVYDGRPVREIRVRGPYLWLHQLGYPYVSIPGDRSEQVHFGYRYEIREGLPVIDGFFLQAAGSEVDGGVWAKFEP